MYEFLIQTNIPIFHHSIIPSRLHEICSIQNTVISISCRNSETFNYALLFEPVYNILYFPALKACLLFQGPSSD